MSDMQRNRTDVVEAALEILDEYGLADLTMRRLAGALGLQPGALYWHFPNKQALLGAVSDAIVAPVVATTAEPETDPARAAGDWDDAVLWVARRLRDALLSRRDGAETVAASVSAHTMTASLSDALMAPMQRSGLDIRHASIAADALLFYILGSASDEQARIQLDSAGALPDNAPPEPDDPSPTERFEFGLRVFVDGVAARAAAATAG